MSINY